MGKWVLAGLFVATVALYAPAGRFEFVNYDDPEHVSANPQVRRGITAEGVRWAFTSGESSNWFPVTRLSHMLDCQLFGARSGPHHLTSVLIHALAAMLLFAFLTRATGAIWPSAAVAFLFALHPLHVESVAWVAERKDVLCAFFWFLGLWAYGRYAERPGARRYALVLMAFILGLLSKPMIVTFPVTLLLVDVWPLRRFSAKAVVEKIPFFAFAAASAIVTYLVQQAGGAVQEFTEFSLGLRIENALVSYVVYIVKMFWPSGLAVFYPYPSAYPAWQVAGALLVLAGISFVAVRRFRTQPYLAAGWLWYLATLGPVIGLVQVGGQARADRYMYVPMVGLTVMLAWGAADIVRRWPRWKPAVVVLAVAAGVGCVSATWAQEQHWETSERLFRHALAVAGEGNFVAHHNLGLALVEESGRLEEAITEFQAALRIRPGHAEGQINLGHALMNAGRLPEAVEAFQAAARIKPGLAPLHNNLGQALAKLGRFEEAAGEFQAALRAKPDFAEARSNLGLALASDPGRLPEAIAELEAALRIDPNSAVAHSNLGIALARSGRLPEAIAEFQTAVRLAPDYADGHYNLGIALATMPGRLSEALAALEAGQRLKPNPELRQFMEQLRGK